ncbi:MAG: CAP domain-containing protein [Clostridiales bacterium]|nr:CAP domain-containing protein [Clostridiales bacterium]
MKNPKFLSVCRTLTFTVLSVIIICGVAYAQKEILFKNVIEREVTVTAEMLNLRTGPGLNFPVVGTVTKGQKLEVIGTLNNWYIVILPDSSIGVISYEYVKVSKMGESVFLRDTGEGSADETGGYPASQISAPRSETDEYDSAQASSAEGNGKDKTASLKNGSYENESAEGDAAQEAEITASDAEIMFDLINKARVENKANPFVWDEKLNRIAELKAADMRDGGYFGHDSPVYGTPFAMLKEMDVSYKSATENIAESNSARSGHLEIMSEVHQRVNVLNSRFNKVGIGIVDGGEWGKIIVEIFIEE